MSVSPHFAGSGLQEPPCHREGLVDYMAPEMLLMPTKAEQDKGHAVGRITQYDEKVDIWQVGVAAILPMGLVHAILHPAVFPGWDPRVRAAHRGPAV